MTATKDVDLRVQAEERARDALLKKALMNYSDQPYDMRSIEPPELAPQEYTETALDPSTYPMSLDALNTKFKGNGNLTSLAGQAVGVPKAPPISMSDFLNKGLSYRVNGRINVDRYDDIAGGGLFPNPSATWDRNDTSYFPATSTAGAGGSGWNNVLVNSWEFLQSLNSARGKVTNVRTLQMKWRVYNSGNRPVEWTGYYMSGANLSELTYKYGNVGTYIGSYYDYSLDLVTGGVPQTPIATSIGSESQRMDAVRSHIENGFLARIGFVQNGGIINRLVDYHMVADFDVAPR